MIISVTIPTVERVILLRKSYADPIFRRSKAGRDVQSQELTFAFQDSLSSHCRWIGTLVCCVTLSACVLINPESYPSDWAPLQTDQKNCAWITGTYESKAKGASSAGFAPSDALDYVLLRHLGTRKTHWYWRPDTRWRSDRLEFAMVDDDVINVIAWQADHSADFARLFARNGDYLCDNGIIQMPPFGLIFRTSRDAFPLNSLALYRIRVCAALRRR